MTVEEAQEIASRVAQEELGPRVDVEREHGYDTHEVRVALPYPYFGAVTCDLKSSSAERVERNVRDLCRSVRHVIAKGIEKHSKDEQEEWARFAIAKRLAGDV